LYTSDTSIKAPKKHIRKTVGVFAGISALAAAVNFIYGIFGHGVHSGYMTWMFLYPLLGGALLYSLICIAAPGIIRLPQYRIFYNLYNSGIATLTLGSFLKGILFIAGTDSAYTAYFDAAGWAMAAAGIAFLLSLALRYRKRLGPIV
jgi:hypothetical protein